MRNKYLYRSRISEQKFRQIIRLFALDLTANQMSKLTAISRNSITKLLKAVRVRIAEYCEVQAPFSGEVEVDESFFGARRVKGKRGRGAFGKTIVFGICMRNGKVYTKIVPNCSRAALQAIIRGKVDKDSIVYSEQMESLQWPC